MPAQVVPFPSGGPRSAAAAAVAATVPVIARAGGAAGRHYSFTDMVRLLQLQGERRTLIAHLRALVTSYGLPAPVNPRAWAGRLLFGAQGVGIHSRWSAPDVDVWMHSQRTPASAARNAPPVPITDRDDMRLRAQLLGQRS